MIPRSQDSFLSISTTMGMEKIEPGSPFRATRLWNMVAIAFRQMPVKAHWYRLQKHEDSFSASEAVDWMHEYLKANPNFGEKSSRDIAVKMLQKLLSHEAFVPVGKDLHPGVFKEDGQLYRFPMNSHNKAVRPLSSYNGAAVNEEEGVKEQTGETGSGDSEHKLTPEEVWCDMFYSHLSALIKLDPSEDICSQLPVTIEVANLIANVTSCPSGVHCTPDSDVCIPQFVRTAVTALEKWPVTPRGVPNTPGFQRSLVHVLEAWLRGLDRPLVDTATSDLLKKCWDTLVPSTTQCEANSNIDASSSVESFMMEILNDDQEGDALPDMCFETAFSGTLPETRLIRKRPRSNSLFPTTDFMVPRTSSRTGSVDYSVPKSLSNSGSGGSSPLMPHVQGSSMFCSDSSLEKLNPAFKDDSFNELEEQFFTPKGKSFGDMPSIVVDFHDMVRTLEFVLLALEPESRCRLRRLLNLFHEVSKNPDLKFSEDIPTHAFICQCFAPIIFPSIDSSYAQILSLMTVHCQSIFGAAEDFRLRVESRMRSLGLVPAFCQRITKQEYKQQQTLQRGHLLELLENIVNSNSLSLKEKRKKLKQFERSYPEIYAFRFANSNSEESILAACSDTKPKGRLAKFKSLRL